MPTLGPDELDETVAAKEGHYEPLFLFTRRSVLFYGVSVGYKNSALTWEEMV